jgi:hypothetical protein
MIYECPLCGYRYAATVLTGDVRHKCPITMTMITLKKVEDDYISQAFTKGDRLA